jgi:hypothetical protein
MSAFDPLRAGLQQRIEAAMPGRRILDALSRRAPMIVAVTLCAALVGYWADAPLWLPRGLAVIVGSLALIVMAGRDRRRQIRTEEEPGSATEGNWIAQELAGKGSPPGFYVLEFFGLVTIMLTDVQGPYATPAWAGVALGAAWGIANARFSTDQRSRL